MPGTAIIDPPPPASGTSLIFDVSTFSDTRIYRPEHGRDRPTYTIRSKDDGKHRFVHRSLDGPVAGEIIFHGKFKRGLGTVTITGSEPVTIEQWMPKRSDGREVVIQGVSYVWIKNPIQEGNKSQSRYEARQGDEVVMAYLGSKADHTFSTWTGNYRSEASTGTTTHITRAHLNLANGLNDDNLVSTLLLSLILFNHLEGSKGVGIDLGLGNFLLTGLSF